MSAMSERHHDATKACVEFYPEPEPRWTVPEFHAYIEAATFGAWRNSAAQTSYAELYNLMEAGIRAAFRDRIPERPV